MKSSFLKSILFFFSCFFLISISLFSQQDLKKEIIAYISDELMEFSDTETNAVEIGQINFLSNELYDLLTRYNAVEIMKGFPQFLDSDTTRVIEGGVTVSIPKFSRIFRIFLSTEEDIDPLIQELSLLYGINYAEKNIDAYPTDDPEYWKQWYLKNTGQLGGSVGADIDAERAWQIFTGSQYIKIGVIDTGVELNHEDLNNKSSGDWPENLYGYDHGSHVAGISAANTNNPYGVKGVDWNARIISKKIFSGLAASGKPAFIGNTAAANKIIDAVNSGVSILNNSWGGDDYSYTIRNAMTYAYKLNVVNVCAIGNSNTNQPHYPAAYGQGIIAVGGTDNSDSKASFSNYGSYIDVVAPAVNIFSTVRFNTYDYMTGTSMAAPIVSGIASLLKGFNVNITNDDIENICKISSEDKGDVGWDELYGYGRVNARAALDRLRNPYMLSHYTTSGGTEVNVSGYYQMKFVGVNGLSNSNYVVRKHEVRKSVSFPDHYNLRTWGNGVFSTGWSSENPNHGLGWTGTVEGTQTSASVTLTANVYEVWTNLGQYKGWYPCQPSQVQFNYTVNGVPLSAPPLAPTGLDVSANEYHQASLNWVANNDPDLNQYKIYWASSTNGNEPQNFSLLATINAFNGQTPVTNWVHQDIFVGSGNGRLYYKISAVDNTSQESALSESDWVAWDQNMQKWVTGDVEIVTEYALEQNYPNPFNPVTTITFQIPKDGLVTLKVYDLLGKEVIILVNEEKTVGKYSIEFNASKLPSGVYLFELRSNEYKSTKKLLLMK